MRIGQGFDVHALVDGRKLVAVDSIPKMARFGSRVQ